MGKRLPRHTELELAFRGASDGVLTEPEGAGPGAVVANVGGEYSSPQHLTDLSAHALYIQNVLPVDDGRYAQTEYGLIHAYGNVREWTASPYLEVVDGRLHVEGYVRIIHGCAWDARLRQYDVRIHERFGIHYDYTAHNTGIRCAF